MASARDARNGVTEIVTGYVPAPMSSAERQRNYRRRKAAGKAAVPGRPFAPGNQAAVTTGSGSPGRVLAVAGEILSELLGSPDCPAHLRNDGGRAYAHLLELWASAMAQSRLLRSWLDSQDLAAGLSEFTEASETETHTTAGTKRMSTARRMSAVIDQLHRAETRAMHLSAQLGLTPLAAKRLGDLRPRFDMALAMAEITEAEETGAAG